MKALVAVTVFMAALVMTGCGAAEARGLCVSGCGLKMKGLPAGWTCENVQEIETAALEAFRHARDERLHSCGDIHKYVVTINPDEVFASDGRVVYATTDCDFHKTILGTRDYKESALPHEMVHMLQDCTPLEPTNEKDYYHSNWERDGIYKALDAVFP